MPQLRELQAGLREAIVSGNLAGTPPPPAEEAGMPRRLAIHSRHYHWSLIRVLMDRFPATGWLLSSELVAESAGEFVRSHPPSRPCLAEYGAEFPRFLARRPGAVTVPYVESFAALEWHVGEVSVEIARPPLSMEALVPIDPDLLPDIVIELQPGVRYMSAAWAVDELMAFYLTGSEPERFELLPGEIMLEVRGARGDVRMDRLTPGDLAFRSALAAGQTLGDAAGRALHRDAAFDPGRALTALVTRGLVTGIGPTPLRGRR